jgi:hypothetical protein
MANTLVRTYDNISHADNVRKELLASGFPPSSVHLASKEDEAGPVKGNFAVGNGDSDKGIVRGLVELLTGRDEDDYQRNFSDGEQRGTCLLTVDANDDEQLARASDILNRSGAKKLW